MKDKYSLPLFRVTAGPGGEAFLIKGKEKSVLHDCGMACFAEELISNIENVLKGKGPDYVILSHSHYDHMGALPYIMERWPEVKVCASRKTWEVFQRESACNMILSMGRTAARFYGKDPDKIKTDGIKVHVILENKSRLYLGEGEEITVFETKGHTDCSLSYFLMPYRLLITGESTGVYMEDGSIHTSVLKSFEESMESAATLKSLPYRELLIPHYGILSGEAAAGYFDRFMEAAVKERALIRKCIEGGMTAEEIFEEHKRIYWSEERGKNHPYRAYKMNTEIIINREMGESGKTQEEQKIQQI